MNNKLISAEKSDQISVFSNLFLLNTLAALMLFSTGVPAEQVTEANDPSPDFTEELNEATEKVNTNDPTAAAIPVSAGWEFYDWHEDEISPGQTRPTGNDNSFNTRFVIPMAKGKWGSPVWSLKIPLMDV